MSDGLNAAAIRAAVNPQSTLRADIKPSGALHAVLGKHQELQAQIRLSESLQAKVSTRYMLHASVSAHENLRGVISQGPMVITGCLNYEGEYDVRPAVEAQELNTAEKRMKKNLTIQGIPYMEVSNTTGGVTVIIG